MSNKFDTNKLKAALSKDIEGNIDTRKRWHEEAVESRKLIDFINLLPGLSENPSSISCDDDTVFLAFRYDKFLKTEIKRIMLSNKFKMTWECKEKDVRQGFDPIIHFKMENDKLEYSQFTFSFRFSDDIKGSTCTRKVIREETKKVEIYEWTCEEK